MAMIPWLALLRAVNVGGRNLVSMDALRAFLADLGFRDVRTLLQSGNAVFRGEAGDGADLERRLHDEAISRLSLDTEFFVRTGDQWREVVAANPFPDQAERDPSHLQVHFLKNAPGESALAALQAAITGPERVHAAGPHLYAFYPDGIGRSRLTTPLIEARLGTRSTARNWNTILRMAQMAQAAGTGECP